MASALETFLAPVYTALGNLKQIDNPSTDERVVESVGIAYSLVREFCRRPLFSQTFTKQRYYGTSRVLNLRDVPVSAVTKVVEYLEISNEGSQLTLNSDYYLVGNTLVFPAYTDEEQNELVEVDYTGGYATADLDRRLLSALVMQSVAVYHSKEYMGLETLGTSSSGGMAQTPQTGGVGLLDSVKEMLSEFRYYGNCE